MPDVMVMTAVATADNPISTVVCPPDSFDVTVRQFRQMFRMFRDSSLYQDETVTALLALAGASLNRCRWGQFYRRGVGLYVAHMLSMARQAELVAERGGAPGFGTGMISGKSVNGVSVSYDTSVSLFENGGDLNMTTFGQEFQRLLRIVGMGPVLVQGTDAEMVTEADLLRGTVGPSFAGGYF